MKKMITLFCIAAAFAFNASAQSEVGSNPGNDNGRDTSAVNFSNQARMAGLKEIKASQLALQKSHDQQVISFATMMVNDHQKANMELISILRSKKYNVPSYRNGLGVTVDPMLTTTSGRNFDKNYVTMMVNDHKMAVGLFTYAANNQLDPDLKEFAIKTLPTLKQHLAAIQAIATNMGLNP
jgi:putative membrane protein